MKRKQILFSYCFLLTSIALLNTGCMGGVSRDILVGDHGTYSEHSAAWPAIPQGKGRVFIYMVDGGPSIMNTLGIVGEAITIDNYIQYATGETFFYGHLKPGKHKLTVTNVIKGTFERTFGEGDNAVDFELQDQEIKYIRIDIQGIHPKFNSYYPVLIESSEIAENEMRDLKLYKDHKIGMIGRSAKVGDSIR